MELINSHNVEAIRTALPRQSYVIEYGSLERVQASGRATCRACGRKIAKGEQCLRFFWDFNGCGSWTSTQCHIHESACPAAN